MWTSVAAFAVFAAILAITPGLDTMLVVRTAAVTGRAAGFAAVAGIALGCLVWAVASALGVTAVLTASRLAFEVLRIAGVAIPLLARGPGPLARPAPLGSGRCR